VEAKNFKAKMKYAILVLLCATVPNTYAKNEGDASQLQKNQYEKLFKTESFAKCNVCHKPFESTVIGSRTIPSYLSMTRMDMEAINSGIEHGGHLSNTDKSEIISVIHPAVQPVIKSDSVSQPVVEHSKVTSKSLTKKNGKKAGKKSKKHRKSKKKSQP
jgi:hypothetical protein